MVQALSTALRKRTFDRTDSPRERVGPFPAKRGWWYKKTVRASEQTRDDVRQAREAWRE